MTICYEHRKQYYLAKKSLLMIILHERTLLEAFLHRGSIYQPGNKFQQWIATPAIIDTA
jgi:hypothetical protein